MSKERIGLMDANGGSAETGRGMDETGMAGGFAESVEQKMDAVRDWFASHCCGFVKEIPSMLFLIFLCLFLALLLSLVPLLFLLFGPVAPESQPIVDMKVVRSGHKFPVPDRIDSSWIPQGDAEDEYGGIPFTHYFPTNVSDCVGFGFSCTNDPHIVISSSLRCNGRADCKDGSDENFCLSCQSPFSCHLDDSSHNLICLNGAQLCDGIAHCPDKFDETFYCRSECREGEHKCGGQNLCLPQEALCNGVDDCRDGSDEKDCEVCIQGAKMCNGRECVAASKLCDGKSDCEDASDEKDCDCRACSSSAVILCDDGTCLSRERVCDGRSDCSNSMDEQNCPGSCMDIKETEMVRCSDSRFYPLAEACRGELSQCASSCPDCHPTAAFACRKEHKCIQQSMACLPYSTCPNATTVDKAYCARLALPSYFFS
ncbi:hypothetical protein WR25_17505 [Diploscapter pachys]|uniref:Uncharacterized protein n=1 Tax=Diploscapter pachys TaxID=2018661 RepID=A0A2A2L6I0_9BILA|nr:hypothetical protein WR25_17505 [Diploscapter pachys]